MQGEGWRRLWELLKWIAAIAAGIWCVMSFTEAMPVPSENSSPAASQIVGMFLAAVIGGGVVYSALHALEWVYRGFRPLDATSKEVTPPSALNPEQPQVIKSEQRPALPHPEEKP